MNLGTGQVLGKVHLPRGGEGSWQEGWGEVPFSTGHPPWKENSHSQRARGQREATKRKQRRLLSEAGLVLLPGCPPSLALREMAGAFSSPRQPGCSALGGMGLEGEKGEGEA